MAIKEVTMYTLLCDRCGADALEGHEFSAFTDPGHVLDIATDNGWVEYEGKHYCDNCVPPCEACGHLYGEHDFDPGPCLECDCKLYVPAPLAVAGEPNAAD